MSELRFAARPGVLSQLEGARHLVVEASAGTGKTYTLENLVIDAVIREGMALERILVVTFTEKAANELKLRLRSKLETLLFRSQESPENPSDRGRWWCLDESARARLEAALIGFDRTTIATIHAFCHRILVEHAFQQRRPFRQSIVDGRVAFERAFLKVLRQELARDDDARPWLEAWLERSSLDALSNLVFECGERGGALSPPFEPARLKKAVADLGQAPTHPRAVRPLLMRGGVRGEGLRRTLERLDLVMGIVEEAGGVLPETLARLEEESPALNELVATVRGASDRQPTLQHLASALEGLAIAVVPFRSAVSQVVLPRLRRCLREEKARRGEVDFSDMLTLVDRSLHGPQGDELTNLLRSRYPVALIDEFQDTDPVQWRIFKRLYLSEGAGGRLVVIGDPKQAIYGFRGADVATYLEARNELTQSGGKWVPLTESFRATPELVAALNQLLDQEAVPPFFSGPINYAHPVRAGRSDASWLEERGHAGPSAILLQANLGAERLSTGGVEAALAESIADEIERLLRGQDVLFRLADHPPRLLKAGEIFVLTRSTREGRTIAKALAERSLPAALYKQEGLLQSREAHDVRALLAAISDPHRPSLAFRAWATPFFGVPLERLADCKDLRPTDPLVARLLGWKALADARAYAPLFASILEESGVVERLLFLGDQERSLTNYRHLFEVLGQEATRGRPPVSELLHRLEAMIEGRVRPEGADGNIERRASDRDAVQIMTMHKAKGLEAEVVFLFGGLRDVPSEVHPYHDRDGRRLYVGRDAPAAAEQYADDETRRLLYVALTRARTRIYVPYLGPEAQVDGLGSLQRALEPHLARVALNQDRRWVVRPGEPAPKRRLTVPADLPPLDDLALPAASGRVADRRPVAELRVQRSGPVITSYSRMKAQQTGREPSYAADRPGDPSPEPGAIAPSISSSPTPGENVLPSGAASGLLLHEVLEKTDLAWARSAPSREVWSENPELATLIDAAFFKYRGAPEHRPHAVELLWSALRTPLRLGPPEGVLEKGLAGADEVVREMEFLFPIPRDPRQGFVKGFIDVVFEHRGKVYVLDWKSDDLPQYDREAIDKHVQDNYRLQSDIYAIATTRLLGVGALEEYEARFGGSIYVFLRGLSAEDQGRGQWFCRPSWSELVGASAQLSAQRERQP